MIERRCSLDDCPRTDVVGYDGLCRKHYGRKRKTGTTELRQRPRLICSVEACGEPVRTRKLCGTHYSRLLKAGDVQADVPIRKLRESGENKPCSSCDILKPLKDFAPDNRHRDGRQARCRECVKAYQKRYRQDNRERYLELKNAEAERSKSTARAWREANRNHMAEQRRAWAASLSEERREAMREYHRKRSTEYREKNQDLCNERIRRWKKANQERILDDVNRRRARQHGNGNPERFTRIEIGERDGWICGICDEPIDKTLCFPNQQSPSLDHIKPLSLGGEHTRANSRITHWICNVRRGIGFRKAAAPVAA